MSGQRKALIVASDEYEQEGLRNLVAPAADAEALAGVLGDPQIGDFDVQVVRNEPSHVIQAQVEDLLSESRPDDVLLLHFSCHGLKSDSGELFFAAANTRPNRLGSTAVSADFVQRCMRASRSRSIVLLLDCCYGGAFAQGVTVRAAGDVNVLDSFPTDRAGRGRGRAVITASTAMEYAFEGEQLADDQARRPSLFTAALTEGLITGDADRDEDGWVSLNELYEYVFDAVRDRNPHQTPSRQVDMQGELYLARSQRRRIQAVPLPADLQAAMTDQNLYTRLGAVSELQVRLNGDNLAAAAGAYAALVGLANDIRYVAEPAAAAVAAAAVRPDPDHVAFGPIGPGAAGPAQRVRLTGPPIARACTLRASDDWIHCTVTEDGFDVAADASRPGQHQATIDIKGPTGRATLPVTLHVLAAPAPAPAPAPDTSAPAATAPAPTGSTSEPAATPHLKAAITPLSKPVPDSTPAPAVTSAPAAAPAAAVTSTADATPAPSAIPTAGATRDTTAPETHAATVPRGDPSLIQRWWSSADTPFIRAAGALISATLLALDGAVYFANVVGPWRVSFVLALLGLAVAALERPPRWTTTFVHALIAANYVVASLFLIHLYAVGFFPDGGLSPLLQRMLVGTALTFAIGAVIVSVVVARGHRDAASLLSLTMLWLIVIGNTIEMVSAYNESISVGKIGSGVLFVAAAVGLASAAALLAARRPAETVGHDQG